ncbi:MAG: class I SAM-dependent methyltransferase [Chitinophagaceae bacterium]|nr:class I SAM-dependent methyltransferase [Chitinophagaceae bacterium]
MNEIEVGKYWNNNAHTWTILSRAGYDIYRDYLNTPSFFEILPDIKGKKGIDIGCGEGHNTRLLADQGAIVEAIDIAPLFIENAKALEKEHPLGINYSLASATHLPFQNQTFDFATSFMCLMDIPDQEMVLKEVFRVLKSGGFFQFSIEHPCFKTPHLKKVKTLAGKTYAFEIGGYFSETNGKIEEWIFGDAPTGTKHKFSKFKVPNFHKTLSFWMNSIIKSGFSIEQVLEPYPGGNILRDKPSMHGASIVAYFLHIRCRKPQKF